MANRTENNLRTNNIPGTNVNVNKFKTKRTPCNPLNPTYKLQSVEFIPPPVPKFIRDGMDHSDIPGAKPKKERQMESRDLFNVGDIAGAKPKKAVTRSKVHN